MQNKRRLFSFNFQFGKGVPFRQSIIGKLTTGNLPNCHSRTVAFPYVPACAPPSLRSVIFRACWALSRYSCELNCAPIRVVIVQKSAVFHHQHQAISPMERGFLRPFRNRVKTAHYPRTICEPISEKSAMLESHPSEPVRKIKRPKPARRHISIFDGSDFVKGQSKSSADARPCGRPRSTLTAQTV